jgi:hypothetical protein
MGGGRPEMYKHIGADLQNPQVHLFEIKEDGVGRYLDFLNA